MAGRDPRLRGLYAITDPALCGDDLPAMADAALAGGARLLQYRNKTADPHRRRAEARALADLCHAHDALFLVNDDPQLALESGADGVHLGQSDTALAEARRLLGPDALIGVTCHADLDLAQAAQAAGAAYVAFGRFFPSRTKPDAPPADLSVLERARATLDLPLCAIGGIRPEHVPALRDAGADMVAAIHGIFGAADITAAARQYVDAFFSESTGKNAEAAETRRTQRQS